MAQKPSSVHISSKGKVFLDIQQGEESWPMHLSLGLHCKGKEAYNFKKRGRTLMESFSIKVFLWSTLQKMFSIVTEGKLRRGNNWCMLPVSPRTSSPGDEDRNRNQVIYSPFSFVQLVLSSKITSILFSTAKTRGLPTFLKSNGKVPSEGAICPHKHFSALCTVVH